MTEHSDEGPGTSIISRALYLLALLADAPGPVTVKQVRTDPQVPPSTAHRPLNALAGEGFVAASGRRPYRIGPPFHRLSARLIQAMRSQYHRAGQQRCCPCKVRWSPSHKKNNP